jgi:hypothetical protein
MMFPLERLNFRKSSIPGSVDREQCEMRTGRIPDMSKATAEELRAR